MANCLRFATLTVLVLCIYSCGKSDRGTQPPPATPPGNALPAEVKAPDAPSPEQALAPTEGTAPKETAAAKPAPPPDPRSPDFIPLGVYWPGEYTFGDKAHEERWRKIEALLDDLAARNANSIWLTHLSAADTAEFSRRAAKRGISIVASCAELAGEVDHIRKGGHEKLIADTLVSWGDAPRPIAWGLGDEPRTAYMGEMAAYATAWHDKAPGEPVTTVVMHGDIPAAKTAGFDILCADIYAFFSAGNPNGYGMPPWAAWLGNLRKLRAATPRPWMMGQAYQEPWGPHEMDDKGNVVYLPDGGPHWEMPTPEQVRWQTLSAIAAGAKGMFYFVYFLPASSNPTAGPANLPSAVKQRTDTGAPRGLIYPDGRPTPQYRAMGQGFEWVKKHSPTLAPLQPSTIAEAWETQPAATGGNVVSLLVHPETGKRWLAVVATYAGKGPQTVSITLGPHVTGLKSTSTGRAVALAAAPPFRSAKVMLAPATAELFECEVDAANLPAAYSDDFTTDKFEKDASKVQAVRRHGDGVLSAQGQESKDQAFVTYDVDKLLGPLPEGGVRLLMYDSASNPPDFRGAFWSASKDGQTFEKLSDNEPGKPVLLGAGQLKVGLSWSQSSAAWAYGCLRSFSITQWKQAAK